MWSLWGTSWILYLMETNFSLQIFVYFWLDLALKRNRIPSEYTKLDVVYETTSVADLFLFLKSKTRP
jgi:hypothetical protein